MYLENGTQELFINTNRSEKFSSVGFLTKIFGGNWKISSSGFNALLIIMTSGNAMNTPQINMMTNNIVFPAMERFNFFSLSLKKRLFQPEGV